MKNKDLLKKTIAVTLGMTMAFGTLMLPKSVVKDGFSAVSAAEKTSYLCEYKGSKFFYRVDYKDGIGKLIITDITSHGETVEVPSVITHIGDDYPVERIDDNFLYKDKTVKNVIFPDSVKSIGAGVLADSTVENVTLPDGLEELDQGFCMICNDLNSVKYNGTGIVEGKMGSRIFQDSKLDGLLNDKGAVCLGNWLINYQPSDDVTSVKLTDLGNDGMKIDSIGSYALNKLNNVASLDLEGIKNIDDGNFVSGEKLTEVKNDESVESVGIYVFKKTKWLENCKEKGIARIGNILFYYRTDEEMIDLESGELKGIKSLRDNCFEDCKNADAFCCGHDMNLPYECFYVAYDQSGEGESMSDWFPAIPTYKIKYIYIDGRALSISYLLGDDNARGWFMRNYLCLYGTAYLNDMMEQKTKKLFKQMDITYYGPGNDKFGTLAPTEEFYIRLKIHNYISIYQYDHEAQNIGVVDSYLLNGKLYCGSYAALTNYLLECAGVKYQTLGNYSHNWNNTKIGDEWFECDDGWDAQNNNHGNGWSFLSSANLKNKTSNTAHDCIWAHNSFHNISTEGVNEYMIGTRTIGDIDCDGDRDKEDVPLLWAYIKGESDTIDKKAGDINFDGKIDVTDAVLLDNLVFAKAIDPDNVPEDGFAPTVRVAFLNGTDYDNIKYLYTDREGYITLPTDLFEAPEGLKLSYDIGKAGEKVRITNPLTVVQTKWVDPNAPEYDLGDVNGDEVIDIEDAVAVIQHINGMTPLKADEEERADVTKDKTIDIDDAVTLISYINGNSTF